MVHIDSVAVIAAVCYPGCWNRCGRVRHHPGGRPGPGRRVAGSLVHIDTVVVAAAKSHRRYRKGASQPGSCFSPRRSRWMCTSLAQYAYRSAHPSGCLRCLPGTSRQESVCRGWWAGAVIYQEAAVRDYIVVGAGSAGCVLAARLTEDPDVRVTLIEAGAPDTALEIHIPAAFGKLFQSKWDWDYLTDPEPGLDFRRRYLPRGKMLGGSSSMNAMIYIRGNPADYDQWAAGGATGWGWADVLPYFLRAEDNERGASDLHGAGGPLTVSDGRSRHALMDAFLDAALQAGHKANDDFNGPEQDGVGYYQLTQRNGMRCSAAVAYLHPAMARPNLEVMTDALCTRILFDGNRAIGVEYERN